MGQVISIVWRWVFPPKPKELSKAEIKRRYHHDNNDDQIHMIIPSETETENDHPRRKSSDHCIDIFDHQSISDSIPYDSVVVELIVDEDDNKETTKPNNGVIPLVAKEGNDSEATDIHEVVRVPNTFSSKQSERKSIGPYDSTQSILLVGEGDFSFSASLAIAFGSASNMVATSLNSLEFLNHNYGSFPMNRLELQSRGAVVIHGVDATRMANYNRFAKMKFDRIIYNFPHSGFEQDSVESQIKRHRKLVRGFMKNAKKMLEEDGQIHITHKSNHFFLQWDIPKLGSDQGLHLIQAVKFKASKFPGYHTKYGFGGDKDFDCNPSKLYKFVLN